MLALEGGQWFWPPGEPGTVRELPDLTAPGSTTRIVTRSLTPLVVEVENFLNADEAEHIIARAKPHMAKSGVALKDADKGKAAKVRANSTPDSPRPVIHATIDRMLRSSARRASTSYRRTMT